MSITSEIARITRALHRAAVALHIAALRGTVHSADSRLQRAIKRQQVATAVVEQAIDRVKVETQQTNRAREERSILKYAASLEAVKVGGSL